VLTHYDFDWGGRPPLYIGAAGSCGFAGANVFRQFYVWEVDDAGATAIHFRQPVGDAFGFELIPTLGCSRSERRA